jgi:hypothetical protein
MPSTAHIIVEGEARVAGLRELPPRDAQFIFEMLHPRDQRLEIFEAVVEHKADRADHLAALVLDRHARHHELFAAEFHDVEQDGLARLRDPAHQAVGDDFLDRAAERFRCQRQAKGGKVFLVDIHHAPGAIDRDRTFAQALQPLEQRFHRAGAYCLGIIGDRARSQLSRTQSWQQLERVAAFDVHDLRVRENA